MQRGIPLYIFSTVFMELQVLSLKCYVERKV